MISSDRYIKNFNNDGYSISFTRPQEKSCCNSSLHSSSYREAIQASFQNSDHRVLSSTYRNDSGSSSKIKHLKVECFSQGSLPSSNGFLNADAYNHPVDLFQNNIAVYGIGNFFVVSNLDSGQQGKVSINRDDGGNNELISAISTVGFPTVVVGTNDAYLTAIDLDRQSDLYKFDFQQPNKVNQIKSLDANVICAVFHSGQLSQIDSRTNSLFNEQRIFQSSITSIAVNHNYLAMGSNEDTIKVIDVRKTSRELATFKEHNAAVLGLEWLDSDHLLSGGGLADPSLRIWCLQNRNGGSIAKRDTFSQVTSIYKISSKTFITTHGFKSTESDSIRVWSIEGDQIKKERNIPSIHTTRPLASENGRLIGSRLLYSAMNQNRDTLVTVSAPESIFCAWKVSEASQTTSKKRKRTFLPQIR